MLQLLLSHLEGEDVWLSRYGANAFHSSWQISHLLELHKCRRFGLLCLWHSGKWPYHSSVIFYKWAWCGKDHWPAMYLLDGRSVSNLLSGYAAQWWVCIDILRPIIMHFIMHFSITWDASKRKARLKVPCYSTVSFTTQIRDRE